jgi:glutathione reductase (NADPH)
MLALGRKPNTEGLGLEAAGVEPASSARSLVDSYSRTNVRNIWAVGDVTDRVQLTPVAIHEAMCFVETAFKDNPTEPDHQVSRRRCFRNPKSAPSAWPRKWRQNAFKLVDIYRAHFRPMRNIPCGRTNALLKLIVDGQTGLVLGAHVLGPDAGEMAQLLGVILKAGLTKEDFDRTMAIHPTAAEELVTMYQPTYRIKHGERM